MLAGRESYRLISVVDVVITPMNPYQPVRFHISSFAVFQSRILIYADEIAEEENVFERKDRFSLKSPININNIKKHLHEKNHISSDLISLVELM